MFIFNVHLENNLYFYIILKLIADLFINKNFYGSNRLLNNTNKLEFSTIVHGTVVYFCDK